MSTTSSSAIPSLPELLPTSNLSSIIYVPRHIRTIQPPPHHTDENYSLHSSLIIEQLNNHIHSQSCGHVQVQHDGHIDYLVGKILHHPHNDHYDIHGELEDYPPTDATYEREIYLRSSSSSPESDTENQDASLDKHGPGTPEHNRTPYRSNSNYRIDKISRTISESNSLDSPLHLRRRNQRLLKTILAMDEYSSTHSNHPNQDDDNGNNNSNSSSDTTIVPVSLSTTKSSSPSPSSSASLWYRDRDALRFILMMSLTGSFMLVELIVGVIVQSLALQADAFHMFGDVLSLGIGFYSMRLARLPRGNTNHHSHEHGSSSTGTSKSSIPNHFSFGYVRMEVIGSLVNGVFLLAICLQIGIEGIQRIVDTASSNPSHHDTEDTSNSPLTNPGQSMLIVGSVGLGINLIGLVLFGGHGGGHGHSHGGGHGHSHSHGHTATDDPSSSSHGHSHGSKDSHHQQRNMNMHGVFLHVLGDALGSVGVVISGVLMHYTTWSNREYADPICSLIIIGIIMFGTFPLVRHAVSILLQRTPDSINVDHLRKDVLSLDGVLSVHDLHIWQLSEKSTIASMHVLLDRRIYSWRQTVDKIKLVLHRYGVHASTVQPEFVSSDVQAKLEAAANAIAQQQELIAAAKEEEKHSQITLRIGNAPPSTSGAVTNINTSLPTTTVPTETNSALSTSEMGNHTDETVDSRKDSITTTNPQSDSSRIGSNNNSLNNKTMKSYILAKELPKLANLLAMDACNEPVCSAVCEDQSCCPSGLVPSESLTSDDSTHNSVPGAFKRNTNEDGTTIVSSAITTTTTTTATSAFTTTTGISAGTGVGTTTTIPRTSNTPQ